ncbi:MAG: hypothetical protein WC785_08665 [Tatlockia sp.]|jgi:hypothetical protein
MEILRVLPQSASYLARSFVNGIVRATVASTQFFREVFRAHYNILGQYTAPIEQELLKTKPPNPRELSIIGQILLTIIPVLPAVWLFSVTLAPLLYNSLVLFYVSFSRITNLTLLDIPHRMLPVPNGKMAWYRILSGALGLAAGLPLGFISAGIVGFSRVLWHSSLTAAYQFLGSMNHFLRKKISLYDGRSDFCKNDLGYPGVVVGGLLSPLAMGAALVWRSGQESIDTGKEIFHALVSKVLPWKWDFKLQKRSTAASLGFGAPGLVVGGLAGIVASVAVVGGRTITNTLNSTYYSFCFVANLALHEDYRLNLGKVKRPSKELYGFGLPGLFFGGFLGLAPFALFGFSRIVYHSALTALSVIRVANNIVRHEQKPIEDTREDFYKNKLGFLGYFIGALAAPFTMGATLGAHVIEESALSGVEIFCSIMDKVLPENNEFKHKRRERLNYDRNFLGAPGLLAGGVFGSIDFGLVAIARTLSNSVNSAIYSFFYVTNSALANPYFRVEPFKRPLPQQAGFGMPGLFLGGLAGLAGFAAAGLVRIAFHTALNTGAVVILGVNFVQKEQISIKDTRKPLERYGLGIAGYPFGLFAAPFAMGIAGMGRTRRESWETIKETFVSIVNLVLPKEIDYEYKDRKRIDHYFFGALGFPLGGFAGSVVFAAVAAGRTVFNSMKSAAYSFTFMSNQAFHLFDQDRFKSAPKDQFGFGLPGFILGIPPGILGFATLGFARVVYHSTTTAGKVILSSINRVRQEQADTEDRRKAFDKKIGLPGYLPGIVVAPFSMLIALMERVANESLKSIDEFFVATVNLALTKKLTYTKSRDFTDSVGFGAPGLLLGVLLGSVGFAVIGLQGALSNSWDTGKRMFTSLTNLGLGEGWIPLLPLECEDERNRVQKYLFGFPGAVVGATVGLLTLSLILSKKWVSNTLISWRSLSGSLLNGGFCIPLFKGLAGDERTSEAKLAGGLGYIGALITTWFPSAVIFTAKKILPVLFFGALGVLLAPLIAIWKGVNQSAHPRFEEKNEPIDLNKESDTDQKFRNIYSSLSPWGQLREKAVVGEEQTGRKGASCFARKSMTFNVPTITEFTLDKLLAAYRADPEHFLDKGMDNALKETKEYYRITECLESAHFIAMREKEIDKLGDFVKKYCIGTVVRVPDDFYSDTQHAWSTVFWGKQARRGEAPKENVSSFRG